MKTIERSKIYQASPEEVFDCLDDLSVTGMHMTKSSMPMMGGKMNVELLSPHQKGLNTKYRWTGKVLWMVLDFTVHVTEWIRGREKSWETVGVARMIIMSWFKMNLKVEGNNQQSTAHLSINYEKPRGFFNRMLSFLLAGWYSRWCLNNMLNDAARKLAHVSKRHAIQGRTAVGEQW
ncbi:MAG TPA: SRPBCC family protein [Chitinophagaceae bacterium]|nr:SRPBCC family protein [Chitinophagaceae bacterium]